MALATGPVATGQGTRLDTRVVRTFDELAQVAEAWQHLQGVSTDTSVFSTWEWNSAAARHFWRPQDLYVTLAEANGQPVGILPLARRSIVGMKALAFLGTGPFDYGRADYQDALLDYGWETEAAQAFIRQLREDERQWDVLVLQDLPEWSRLLKVLPQLAREQGWSVAQQPDNDVYWIPLPATWDEYTATLSTNVRSNLGRKQRKLEREHNARFERVEDGSELDTALERLFDLHNHRWHEKHGSDDVTTIFSEATSRDFHRDVAANLLQAGMLDLTLLHAGHEVIGARYSFEYRGSKSFYASGYRTDDEWGKFSLGAVMDLQSIQASINGGLACEDLLRNEGEYKARYAPQRSDNQRLLLFRTRAAQLRHDAYYGLRRTAKRLLRRGHA